MITYLGEVFNRIVINRIFVLMKNKTKELFKGIDTGLRGNVTGKFYIDREVFFKRNDVIQVLEKVRGSKIVKEMSVKKDVK